MGDGAILSMLIGFPVPFILAAISTVYEFRRDRHGGEQ